MESNRIIRSIIRDTILLTGCLAVLVAIVLLELWGVSAHAAALWSALQALGTDTTPLSSIPVLGSVFAMFGGEVSLSETLALMFAAVEFALCFAVAKLLLRLIKNLIAIVQTRFRQGVSWAEFDSSDLAVTVLALAALATFMYFLLVADWQLYVFRTNADAVEGNVAAWTGDSPDWLRAMAQATAYLVANAYIFVFLGGAVMIALLFHRIDDTFERLCTSWHHAWLRLTQGASAPAPQQLHYGYDSAGQPVFDPHQPVAYDPDGRPVAADQAHGHPFEETAPEQNAAPAPRAAEDEAVIMPNAGGPATERNGHDPYRYDSVQQTRPKAHSGTGPATSASEQTVPLVPASGMQSMPLARLLADPAHYRLDFGTGQWWERELWDALHGNLADPSPRRDVA